MYYSTVYNHWDKYLKKNIITHHLQTSVQMGLFRASWRFYCIMAIMIIGERNSINWLVQWLWLAKLNDMINDEQLFPLVHSASLLYHLSYRLYLMYTLISSDIIYQARRNKVCATSRIHMTEISSSKQKMILQNIHQLVVHGLFCIFIPLSHICLSKMTS